MHNLTSYISSKILLTAFLLISTNATAELNLITGLGTDNNPFRLADPLTRRSDSYLRTEIRYQWKEHQSAYIRLDATKYQYQLFDDADSTILRGRLGYETDIGKNHQIDAGLKLRDKRKSYVSRFRGKLFSFRNQDASNRYNYSRIEPYLKYEFRSSESTVLGMSVALRDQKYKDLRVLGLSDLNYRELRAQAKSQWKLNDRLRLAASIAYRNRDFDTRQARDITGQSLSQTTLKYEMTELGLSLRYRVSKNTKFFSKLTWIDRADNGGGYYDYRDFRTSLRLTHRGQIKDQWTAYIVYGDLDYSRGGFQEDIERDVEAPSRQGINLTLEYERPLLRRKNYDLNWYLLGRYWDYEADIRNYTYKRSQIETGLRLEFN